jgi:hypothetical protein
MPDYSLVPVDYQPDFSDASLVPVDHDPFGGEVTIQQAQVQPVQIQPQPASPPQPPATGAGQPDAGAPVIGNGPGDVGAGPNPASDQGGAEPLPFGGFANPTPAESLVNQAKMDDQKKIVEADRTGNSGAITDGGDRYMIVTTEPTHRYLTPDQTGVTFTATRPFYAFDGTRYALIDANPVRPVTVTIPQDGRFTLSRP